MKKAGSQTEYILKVYRSHSNNIYLLETII